MNQELFIGDILSAPRFISNQLVRLRVRCKKSMIDPQTGRSCFSYALQLYTWVQASSDEYGWMDSTHDYHTNADTIFGDWKCLLIERAEAQPALF